MTGRTAGNPGAAAGTERVCRCEATVPTSVLDGFACGRADCWRTAEVQASFDAFVTELVRRRDGSDLSSSGSSPGSGSGEGAGA